jgi:hypothetical protein
MKRPAKRTIGIAAAILLSAATTYFWLTFGVYSDREFGGLYLFSKHRLSFRFYFYAPLGESDRDDVSVSPAQRRTENDFHDFVEVNGGYERGRKHQLLQ